MTAPSNWRAGWKLESDWSMANSNVLSPEVALFVSRQIAITPPVNRSLKGILLSVDCAGTSECDCDSPSLNFPLVRTLLARTSETQQIYTKGMTICKVAIT